MNRICIWTLLLALSFWLCACTVADSEASHTETESAAKTEFVWPAMWLPDGFPVAEYVEIYSIEQTDRVLEIILFADEGPSFTFPTVTLFTDALLAQGYIYCHAHDSDDGFFVNQDGYMVRVDSSDNFESPLSKLNEHSPTGFTYSIRVEKSLESVAFLFWEYPSEDSDLGYADRVFETWPSAYLPEGIPKPDTTLTVERMEQRKNGIFITVKGSFADTGRYLLSIYQNGFYEVQHVKVNENGFYEVQIVNVNKDGEYFYVQTSEPVTSLDGERTFCFQFCGRKGQS